jgi:hypothetical protein
VCQALLKAVSAMRGAEDSFSSGLSVTEHFWKPLGQQIVGVLVSHLRKLSITETGAHQLNLDMAEYVRLAELFQVPEVDDMMACLSELCTVFSADGCAEAKRVITEDLRHLDTIVVLAVSKARSDYGSIGKGADHWTRLVAASYGMRSHRWEFDMPWEPALRRFVRTGTAEGGGKSLQGPSTLRKSAQPVSNLYVYCYTMLFLSFLVCNASLSLSLSLLSIYCCLLAFSDTT